jgi:hypothetical protein
MRPSLANEPLAAGAQARIKFASHSRRDDREAGVGSRINIAF